MIGFFLRHRRWLRRAIGLVIVLVLFSFSAYPEFFVKLVGPYPGLVYGAIYLLTEFGQSIYGWFENRLGESAREKSIRASLGLFVKFIRDYFGLTVTPPEVLHADLPLIVHLDRTIESLPAGALGHKIEHPRRLKILPLIFLLKYRSVPKILCNEDLIVIAKIRYRDDLSDPGRKECIAMYRNLVMNDRNFKAIQAYFSAPSPADAEAANLHFLDHYMKDDYVNLITEKLRFSDVQTTSFKKSVEAIAKSDKFNLQYLKEFVVKRKKYRKLFLITSASGLSKSIQAYIKQSPYFVLNRTPIVNLPKIGRSAFLDIFFFSPLKVVSSPKDLIRELRRIDPGVSTHPMKIYEVDPFDSISSALGNDRDFLQAMRYFENLSFDSSQIGDLNFGQVLSVLEQSQVSLKEIINELPVTELSSDISEGEKAIIKRIYDGFTKAKKGYSIFQIVGKEGQIKKKIRGLTKADLCGDQEIGAVFSGLKTAVQARNRLLVIAEELNSNVKALNTSLA